MFISSICDLVHTKVSNLLSQHSILSETLQKLWPGLRVITLAPHPFSTLCDTKKTPNVQKSEYKI